MQKENYKLADSLANRPYQEHVFLDKTTDGELVYVSLIPELPGCASHGKIVDEALMFLNEAKAEFIYFMLEDGLDVPEPKLIDTEQRINVSDYMENVVDHVGQPLVPRGEFLTPFV